MTISAAVETLRSRRSALAHVGILLGVFAGAIGIAAAQSSMKASEKLVLYSKLQIVAIDGDERGSKIIYTTKEHIEAPMWTRDGRALIFSQGGKIWMIDAGGGTPKSIEIEGASDCGGSHGISPDGKWLAATCTTEGHPGRRVYIVAITGGTPRMVTEHPDSYFHSWSPDGKTIAFTRPSHGSGNIFAISVNGGAETALTTGSGISDDPDYSPDGKYIYFNSDRGGTMQIWRMRADGSDPEQMTFDEMNNWTPHPSPDGTSILLLSYRKEDTGHPANREVQMRLLTPAGERGVAAEGSGKTDDKRIRAIVNIVGGAGSDNVNNWAPDGTHFAVVSYQTRDENEGSTK